MIIFVGGIDELKKQSISNKLHDERLEQKVNTTSLNIISK